MPGDLRPSTGHLFRVERGHGPVWYAKYRLADGWQVQKKLGPAWSERGRPPVDWFTKVRMKDLTEIRVCRPVFYTKTISLVEYSSTRPNASVRH